MLSLVYYGGLFIITVMIRIILLLERKTDRPKTACETASCTMRDGGAADSTTVIDFSY